MVGEKLWKLGGSHQVLCVTHLPQLAAYGNQHFHVYKQVSDGRTTTQVEELRDERRMGELASMLGGDNEANRTAAREALQSAQERKRLHFSHM
jgi:DNA repair protein RecN (Recombination protein N)